MIQANNPALRSWIPVPENSDFPIQNIPFGIAQLPDKLPNAVTIIGDTVIDIWELADAGLLEETKIHQSIFGHRYLNDFLKLNKADWRAVRNRLSNLFNEENQELQGNEELRKKALYAASDAQMLMPIKVGDYSDFYASKEHATNIGTMFRGKENALMPNWLHLPVGYHGRASSIVVSGTEVRRPMGQMRPDPEQPPIFGTCKLLDFELEMGIIMGQGKPLGERISTTEATDHIFGVVLFNDWSARDIQKWEYVPLGPFLGKSFASSISPWIVTLDALEPFRAPLAKREVPILPYLEVEGNKAIDINLSVEIQPEGADPTVVCRSNIKHMYWAFEQMLAHHTVNGCNIEAGDMIASGTISGLTPDSYGSMLELSWRGSKPLPMSDGSERKFIQDGDTVIMKGHCENEDVRIGFGEVTGKILPAHP